MMKCSAIRLMATISILPCRQCQPCHHGRQQPTNNNPMAEPQMPSPLLSRLHGQHAVRLWSRGSWLSAGNSSVLKVFGYPDPSSDTGYGIDVSISIPPQRADQQ